MKDDDEKILYFGVKAQIIGDFLLKEPIVSHSNGFQISIFIEKGVYNISVIKAIGNNEALKPRVNFSSQGSEYLVPNETDYKDYIQLLQHIESIGGFHYGIKKIFLIDTLELIWYTGGKTFQDLEPILAMNKARKEKHKNILSQSNLSSILLLNRIIPDAVIPYNFYREANLYLETQSYRDAYLHFYMLLEFCFAEGKTGIDSQVEAFIQNEDYILALLQTLKLFKEHNYKIYDIIYKETIENDKNKTFNIKTITRLLYSYRGKLAHGTSRAKPYVFNEALLMPLTIFISSVCFSVCGHLQIYAAAFTSKKNMYINQHIEELKKSLSIS